MPDPTNAPQGRPLTHVSQGLSVAEAARQLGVHHQTIRNWIRSGKLPVTRFGPSSGIVRIHPQDLQDVGGPH